MKTKLSPRFWCALTLFGLIGQVAWVVENMYLNVFIYNMFNATAEDISNMVMASAIAATLTTVLVGALSDRIGKRKLFICGGYLLWGISILGFCFVRADLISPGLMMTANASAVGVSLVIILDCVMTFFGSSANDAAFNAWLTDSTDSTNRGAAEGINAMMPLVAILVVFGGFMFTDPTRADHWTLIFAIIGGVVIAVGLLGIFLIKDPAVPKSETGYWQNVIYGFRPSTVRHNPTLYIAMGLFILFNISIQVFMPYLILYYQVSLGMADYVLIMAPAILLASVATALWGKVYDKRGFGFSAFFALLALSLGYLVLFLFRSTAPVFLGSLLMMCGYLCGMAVFGARIRDFTPQNRAGMLQGVRICSQVLIPGIIGPMIGRMVLANAEKIQNNDGTESFIPNANIFLAALIVLIPLALCMLLSRRLEQPRTVRLTTPFEEEGHPSWKDEYPRPQMQRDSYFPLAENWTLTLEKGRKQTPMGEIQMPFPPESPLSGIGHILKKGEAWIYETAFALPDGFVRDRVLLHFGAVDQVAEVTINGVLVTTHRGGYLPFSCDITDHLKPDENHLAVRVTDPLDHTLPWGKQRHRRGGMWYTPISGIWQPVWIESVPENAFTSLCITPTMQDVTITVMGGAEKKTLTVQTPRGDVVQVFDGDTVTFTPDEPLLWSPEHPHLYPFTLTDGTDTVTSYFALREISVLPSPEGIPMLALNGKPYFFHGLLDQGYYPDGIYLPASPDGYRYDIAAMKSSGFNTLRKHIKIEPAVFYHECDKQGMVVFQDMVNSGGYSFLFDTALPTVGIKSGLAHRASKEQKRIFEEHARETLDLLHNYPSVLYYTIFNEGWGQYKDADRVYDLLKSADPTRIYDTASGWFRTKKSDVDSEHVYFKPVTASVATRPLVLSEFGGYSCKLAEHSFNLDKTYGYRFFSDRAAFEDALEALYRDEIIPLARRGLSAAILTQVSDVEDETNGLLTYDRRVLKISPARMQQIAEELKK